MHSEVKVPISVIIPTRNEEKNIRKCLESVSWADKIFVVDSASTDRTVGIAKEYTDNLVTFHWNGKWPRKKNWALEKLPLSHEWVLFLDADEQVTPELAEEIRQVVSNGTEFSGFMVKYDYYFLGRLLKHGDPLWKCIFFKHGLGRFEKMNVPEVTDYDVEVHEHPVIKGKVGKLKNKMIHHDFEDLHHFFHRHNIYSDWEAHLRSYKTKRNKEKEIKASLFGSQIERRRFLKEFFLKFPGKPVIYFLYSYFIRGGFLDGKAGYIYNVLKAFHWFSVEIKLYEEKLRLENKFVRPPLTIKNQKQKQMVYFNKKGLSGPEIVRPHNFGKLYEFLIGYKMQKMAELVAESLEGKTVLNICCGSGMEAEYFANLGVQVTGLDVSLGAVKGARIRSERFDFELKTLVGDAESLPFKPESFDFVFTHDGLHHLPHPEKGITEMARVANRGIFFTEPADAFITRLAVKLGFSANQEESGNLVQRLNASRLEVLFDQLGLSSSRFLRYGMWYAHYPPKWFSLFENKFLFNLFKTFFHLGNSMFGKFGNKLVAVAWKDQS